MKKKVIAVLLASTMLLSSLMGCSGGNTTKEEKKEGDKVASSDEEIELNVWHIYTDSKRAEVLKNAIARFNEEYPNVKVTEVANENDPYKTKLATAMAAGEEPDIIVSWGGGWLESYIDEGKILNINDQIEEVADDYYESALSLFEFDGQKYALPISCGPAPVYYNKQIYKDLGLEVPKTLAELEENCDKIKEAGITPFALANSSQWPGALTFIWLSLRYGGKEEFLNAYNRENGGTFEDESFIKAGHKIQEWVEKGYYPDGYNAMNFDTGASRMLFYGGSAAHIIQTNGMFANCTSEAPDFYENNLGIFNFPVAEDGKGNEKEILGGGNGWSITSACEHPEEAFALIRYLSDKEFSQDNVDNAGVVTGAKGVKMPNELTQQVDDMLNSAEYIQNFYDQFLPTEMGTLHKQTTYDIFGLTTTPEKAAADMEQLGKEVLDK